MRVAPLSLSSPSQSRAVHWPAKAMLLRAVLPRLATAAVKPGAPEGKPRPCRQSSNGLITRCGSPIVRTVRLPGNLSHASPPAGGR